MAAKIVHLIGQLNRGGAERQLLYLAGALQAQGWPQAVVSFGVHGAWNDRVTAAGIPLYEVVPYRFKPRRLWRLSGILRRERPAILQIWSAHLAEYIRWVWGKACAKTLFGLRIDLTVDIIGGDPLRRLPSMRGLQTADYAVGNSALAFENLRCRGVRLPPHEVISNIVIPGQRADAAEPVAVPRIVCVGSLIPRKDYDCVLRAAALLVGEGRRFELLVAGEGTEPRQAGATRVRVEPDGQRTVPRRDRRRAGAVDRRPSVGAFLQAGGTQQHDSGGDGGRIASGRHARIGLRNRRGRTNRPVGARGPTGPACRRDPAALGRPGAARAIGRRGPPPHRRGFQRRDDHRPI